MDWIAYEIANRALGNPEGAAAVEISLGGIELACEGAPLRVAFAGGGFAWSLLDASGSRAAALPRAAVVRLDPGQRLRASAGGWGVWTYLAVEGGVDVPPVLGSRSTYARFSIGGLDGRPLRAGDRLAALPSVAAAGPGRPAAGAIVSEVLEKTQAPIRVILGPQDDYFTRSAIETFFREPYAIDARFDRMGYWLNGPALRHAAGFDIVSDGIALGAIQVPGSGVPVVLMADHQATGGYPKLGTVIRADVGRLAQHRPGERVRFEMCNPDAARRSLLAIYQTLGRAVELRPLQAGASEELLFQSNLIGGITDGSDLE
jgi:biotin-dependent carboxylase-like uncharacterized protein